MCGLVGMAGNFQQKHKAMMLELLYLDTLRGRDSTGVAAIRSKEVQIVKKTLPGYEFIELGVVRDALRLNDYCWLGHNRWKTVGNVSRLNAHPFDVVDDEINISLVGAHNGTLDNKYEIDKGNAFGTDSEALLNLIADVGPKEAISRVRGAWALTWYDCAEDAVYMIHNGKRPLCFAFQEDKETLFWASEKWMLEVAADRNDIKIQQILSPKENILFRFDVPMGKHPRKFEEPHTEGGLVGAPEPVKKTFQQGGYYGGGWTEDSDGGWEKKAQTQTQQTPAKETGKTNGSTSTDTQSLTTTSQTSSLGMIKGFQGKEIEKSLVKLLLEAGCSWCDEPMKEDAKFAFIDEHDLVCMKCVHDKHFANVGGKSEEQRPVIMLNDKQKEQLAAHKRALEAAKIKAGMRA